MDENVKQEIDKKRDKRKRVHRMKMAIVYFIAIYMALTIIIMTFLCIKVISLQRQVNSLKTVVNVTEQTSTSSPTSDVLVYSKNGTAESNLAQPDDILKVYLTFDDGPSSNTSAILDVLDDYGVKATFFVTGKEDEEYQALYKRIVDEGHTIAMHSYSHQYSEIYASKEAFESDLSRIENLIYDTTGVEPTFYRFPGGSSNKVSNADMVDYIKLLNEQGITYFDWNVSCGDATSQAYTSDELIDNVMADVVKYKTSVVLLHDADSKTATVEALPRLIESLQSQGAMVLPISEDTTVIQHVSLQTEE